MANSNGSSTSRVSGGRLGDLTAQLVNIDRSAVRSLDADGAQVDKSAIQRLRARQATIDHSGIGLASLEQATLRQSNAGVVIARSVACDEVRTGVLISPVIRGEVHTWLDLRSAVAIGFGMVLGKAVLSGARALARLVLK
jgi:hypothetical protein